ncbi:MAG: ABC transporter permease [Candidatus Hecatellales archaeon]|nr:MAG: ABC transporter permease [Candidatus Hecatellales archaeon]
MRKLLSIAALLAVWETAARLSPVPRQLFPPFTNVLVALWSLLLSGQLLENYLITLARTVSGFILGAGLGVLIGLALVYRKLAYETLYPVVTLLYAIPAVAWIPLFMIWVGLNEALPISVVFMCSFAPMVYITLTGARKVEDDVIKVARTLGANDLKIVTTILFPQALPSILSGLKVEAGMAWRSCFVAEMVAMSSGLGFIAMEAESILRVDIILAVILVLAISNYLFQELFEKIEVSILRRWGISK